MQSGKGALASFFSGQSKESEEVKLDALAAASLALDALRTGPVCEGRRVLLQMAVDVLRDTGRLPYNTLSDVEELLHLMHLTANLTPSIRRRDTPSRPPLDTPH
eukprot:2349062-Pyramimonas_sp.AAC.1